MANYMDGRKYLYGGTNDIKRGGLYSLNYGPNTYDPAKGTVNTEAYMARSNNGNNLHFKTQADFDAYHRNKAKNATKPTQSTETSRRSSPDRGNSRSSNNDSLFSGLLEGIGNAGNNFASLFGFGNNTLDPVRAAQGYNIADALYSGLPKKGDFTSIDTVKDIGKNYGFNFIDNVEGAGSSFFNDLSDYSGLGLGLLQGYLGLKNYGLAKDALAQNQAQFEANYAAQAKLMNDQLRDKYNYRHLMAPDRYTQTGDEYVAEHGIEDIA